MLPEYTPLDLPRSKRSMISMVRCFGAPVMEPPGNAATIASSAPHPGLNFPRTVDTSCVQGGCWGDSKPISSEKRLGRGAEAGQLDRPIGDVEGLINGGGTI